MKGDLNVIGPRFTRERRVAASTTRFEPGEPLIQAGASLSSGAASANVFAVAAIDIGVIGTDNFGGISIKLAEPRKTGTLVAQTVPCACPIPNAGKIQGKAETAANIDTESELLAIIQDAVTIDYNATGAPGSNPLYTIKDTAAADTSAFTIVGGNISKGLLEVEVDARFYRIGNTVA